VLPPAGRRGPGGDAATGDRQPVAATRLGRGGVHPGRCRLPDHRHHLRRRRCADLDRARAAAPVVVAGDERVDLADALVQLRALGHEVVLCEGGPTLLGELAAAGLLDELCLTLSPMMGGDPLPVAVTPRGGGVTDFELRHTAVDAGTLFLRYETRRHGD